MSQEGQARGRVNADGAPPAAGHFMYVVECADLSLYTGYTVDVAQRVAAHNAGTGAKYTAARRPVRLIASAAFATKHEAMSAEFRFKRLSRPQKEEMLAQVAAGSSFEALLAARFPLGG